METINPDENKNQPELYDGFEVIKMLYEQSCNDWRHYDSHVWQIPSLALAINILLVGQAFNQSFTGNAAAKAAQTITVLGLTSFQIIRSIIVLFASFFTFVLLLALVKHRLHQRGKDQNIKDLEELLVHKRWIYDFANPKILELIEPHPNFITRIFAPLKANLYLMWIMVLTIIIDFGIILGILFGGF